MLYGIKIKIYFKIYKCIKTDWIWCYDLYPRSFILATQKGVNLIFFSKNEYFDFFTALITIYSNWPKNIINKIKDVLVSIKPKFSYKLFNFYEKNANFTFFRKVKIIFNITKQLE